MGQELNVKVLLKVYRSDGVVERFIVDTEPRNVAWNYHQRVTRDFFVHPFPKGLGRVTAVKFAYIVHLNERSIPSEHEYIWMDGHHFDDDSHQRRALNAEHATPNTWRTVEADAGMLQRDVDWINGHFDSLNLVPKFTKGVPYHPYHPKRYIHDQIDAVIRRRWAQPDRMHTIKVCVDCIDDTDFTNHLLHAAGNGVLVQVQVDWRKMTLTNSPNYLNLKRSGIELVGVFCTPKHPKIEVAPDMHNKFIIFGDRDSILGSFNITFDRWGANWESGMSFHSKGMARLLDNIFQSIRGGVIQKYTIDPLSHFNLLYTYGRQLMPNGHRYRPHQAILSEIHRAQRSIKLCLFLIGEMTGEHERQCDRCPHLGPGPRRRRPGHPQRPSRPQGRPRPRAHHGRGTGPPAAARRLPSQACRRPRPARLRPARPAHPLLPHPQQILHHRRLQGPRRLLQLVQHLHLLARPLRRRRQPRRRQLYLNEFHQTLRDFRMFA